MTWLISSASLIYDQRRWILTSPALKDTILGMVEDELRAAVALYTAGDPIEWELDKLLAMVRTVLPLDPKSLPAWQGLSVQHIDQQLLSAAQQIYEAKEQQMGSDMMRQLERMLMLKVVDDLWVRHLTALDELREGIGLRAFAQRDPLIEYKREAFDMFDELKAAIAHDVSHRIFFVQLQREPVRREMHAYRPGAEGQRSASGHSRSGEKVGRNDPCPCGSGKKYKNCCLHKDLKAAQGGAPQPTAVGAGGVPQSQPARTTFAGKKKRHK